MDALAGIVSVVENGRIIRNLDGDGLRRKLTGGLDNTSPPGGGRPTLFSWRTSGPKP